ncbi:MAG: hypothetical protein A3F17_04225 [Gammaproteobacteria bacterium RIFCSPHIGHO2_12_FULL_41_15]|nr:MAG: hypothetical protein A3F17_04225 [Gammaproteobacteria bacterium RIFCSPHIGHO2_12_FULL_41_15]
MNKEYENQEYHLPEDEAAQEDFAATDEYRPGSDSINHHGEEAIADYVEIDDEPKKSGVASKFGKVELKNKRVWFAVIIAIALVIGAVLIKASNHSSRAIDPSTTAPVQPTVQSQAELLAMKQQLNMRNSQMQQETSAMQSQFYSVKQQVTSNQQALGQVQQAMQQMQMVMNQMAATESQLNAQLQMMNTKMSELTTPKESTTVAVQKPVVTSKPSVYTLQAIDAGGDLAWIQDQQGRNITVRVGDTIPNDKGQKVVTIDTMNGQLITNQGKLITYKA